MREATEYSVDIGDIELAVIEWPGTGDPILLLHATGFHGRCWTQVVERLPGRHVYAVDLRFHGSSGKGDAFNWSLLTDDICQLIERLDLSALVGVGHSIGGFLIARAAARLPHRFRALLLVDPVIMPRETYARFEAPIDAFSPDLHPVSRRKNRWQDSEEMYRRFAQRPPFDRWQAAVLRDYCEYALRPADDEGWLQLACDPLHEAAAYANQAGNEKVYDDLPALTMPVTVLRAASDGAAEDLSTSPTWPGLAATLPDGRDVYLPRMSHFIPMEDPGLVARYILQALGVA